MFDLKKDNLIFRRFLWLITFCIVCQPALSQDRTTPPDPDSLWMSHYYIKREVLIPMRDGVKLFTSVYQPRDTAGKHPILLTRTPYSSAPYGQAFKDLWKGHFNHYIKGQYIMVIQDVRGRWMSEGQFENIRPFDPRKTGPADVDEASDAYDTMDWLINNIQHNNGNIGVYGGSYGGFYTLMAGLSGHPALKAISPQAPVTDWFIGDDFHHNGAFFAMDAFAFLNGYDKPRPAPTTQMDNRVSYFTKDNYKFYLETGAIKNLTRLTGDSIAFWRSLMDHPDHDDWWKKRTVTDFLQNLHTPTLVVGSPFDAENAYGAWNTYKKIKTLSPETNVRLIMGPWYHMQWVRGDGASIGHIQFGSNTSQWYAGKVEYPFFDHYLKGMGKGPDTKEVTIFFSGANQWREFTGWPPGNKHIVPYFLAPEGKLTRNPPQALNAWTEYVSDPARPVPYTANVHFIRTLTYMTDDQRFASRRPDVLVFQTTVLEEDITLAGQPEINLSVSISGTDADFIVKLIDVFPEDFSYGPDAPSPTPRIPSATYPMGGYQMLVKGDVMRGKYRNSFEHPEPFIPGKPTIVKFNLPDVAHTFKKGHRIMIQVQSSWFPLVDRNPQQFLNIYKCDDKDFKKATIRVFHQKADLSYIGLPVVN